MAAGQSPAPKRSAKPRPTLSSHIAHAHAFAVVPTPGNPASARSSTSYFPLPTPPAPLRAFALQHTDPPRRAEGDDTTAYPTSSQQDASARAKDKQAKEARSSASAPEPVDRKSVPRSSRTADSSTKTHSRTNASISSVGGFQFATAAPFGVNTGGSSYVSSPGAHSARSALSIAEIDCFFVQGSRSSTYSAQSHSPRSQPVTGSARSDHSAEPTLSSNDEQTEAGSSEIHMSDQAERERKRAERQAFMKARKLARDELRKQRRVQAGAVDELSSQTKSDWREAIKSQGTIPLTGIPLSRESIRERKRANTMNSERSVVGVFSSKATTSTPHIAPGTVAPPSGPGPPEKALSDSTSVGTLSNDFATHLSLSTLPSETSETRPNKYSAEQTPAVGSPTVPTLSRFDSDETEVGSASRQAGPQPESQAEALAEP